MNGHSYFYTDGNTSFGPFSLEDLKKQHITRDTLIWYQGLGDWTRADALGELAELFELLPPVIIAEPEKKEDNSQKVPQYGKPPKTWLLESILSFIFCCFPFSIAGVINAVRVETLFYAGLVDEAKEASAKAKKWATVSLWIGIGFWVLYILFYFVLVVRLGVLSETEFFSTFDSSYAI